MVHVVKREGFYRGLRGGRGEFDLGVNNRDNTVHYTLAGIQ